MVAARARILGPLERLGVSPDEVADVVFSHHHPDHTLNAALFRAEGAGSLIAQGAEIDWDQPGRFPYDRMHGEL
jgi:glyoxylase-like metal-dependent hydrolase (beta-lactamase superfamily II)